VSALTALLEQGPADGDLVPNDTASQRANLAIALLRLGRSDRLWPMLKMSENPRTRSFLIDRFAALGCEPGVLLARLEMEPDDTIRAALWLGLGGFDDKAFPAARRIERTPKLQGIYRQDPSAAVHAAAHWLLGKWGSRPSAVGAFDKDKGWYVNSSGQTMIRIVAPKEFMMGSPPDEPEHIEEERLHQARIDSSYDIAMTEVTVGQFRRFLEQRKGSKDNSHYAMQAGLATDIPVTKVTWFDAAEYCNWLTKAEFGPDQCCYLPNATGKFAGGMKIAPPSWKRIGYRLPTETEWEYACRGGAVTSRCYGDADELLPRYAWFALNARDEYAPVATLLPNAFGLFDMHGNTSEWCQDVPKKVDRDFPNAKIEAAIVTIGVFRAVRGGSIVNYLTRVRSAQRFADPPATSACGFRIACSRP